MGLLPIPDQVRDRLRKSGSSIPPARAGRRAQRVGAGKQRCVENGLSVIGSAVPKRPIKGS
jgi:hypothetical protein